MLDEPSSYWDYRALKFYGELTEKAKGRNCTVNIDYRIDISRPQFDRGQLKKTSSLWVVGTNASNKFQRLVNDRKFQKKRKIWIYGTTNPVGKSNRQTMAWIMSAFLKGASGVVPWQTVDKRGKAMKNADQLGLFVFSNGKIYQSLRLKAYRRAQQDIEYLLLLKKKYKLSDKQLREFILHYLPLKGETIKKYASDAGTENFSDLSPKKFRKLRSVLAKLIFPHLK